ncbi:hypothetical protein [Paraburkholderia sp. PGU19]|uniref:hypothetical protein n=1 Tax=Paraburkholderia sp. PGU19 TaxID=2735434 RepID=UPI001FB1467D|nr:hypothetical protein [Paraburkholderia sp. PGU19]
MTHKPDDPMRVDLLCHLVIAQLIARARTGDWLRTDHFVESKRLWSQINGVSPDSIEGARLAIVSAQLVTFIWASDLLHDVDALSGLFTDNFRLDFDSPIVSGIYDLCMARLKTWRYES